jgi:hypothetical protein
MLNERWLWLGGSFLLAVLSANLAWLFRKYHLGKISDLVSRLTAWPFSPWLFQFLRLVYYVGVPSAALMWRRVIVEQYLGLSGGTEAIAPEAVKWTHWARSLGWAAVLGIGTLFLLALGWWSYRRASTNNVDRGQVAATDVSVWVLLREAIYHELHWAFYRNAPIVALHEYGGDTYWGIWIGLAIVTLEAILNPAWRKDLADPREAPARLMRGALAIVSSVLFWEMPNLWLAMALHLGVSWALVALTRVLPLSSTRQADQISTC